jgi:DNA-binding transcriptional regulator YiaG
MEAEADVEEMLAPTATTSERVRGLLALPLSPAVIATATNSSPSTIRNWSIGQTEPRPDAAIALDDLRMVAKALLKHLEPERAARWLTSRDPNRLDGMRPVEMIRIDPMAVLAAANAENLSAR